jgi:hypothetical protein
MLLATVALLAVAPPVADAGDAFDGNFDDDPTAEVRVRVFRDGEGDRRVNVKLTNVPLPCTTGETVRRDFDLRRLGFFKPAAFGYSRSNGSRRIALKGRLVADDLISGWLTFDSATGPEGTRVCSTPIRKFRWTALAG